MGISEYIKEARKAFGEEIVYIVDEGIHVEVDAISTGIRSIDGALGINGIPRGRMTEIWGREGTGKTTLCFHTIAEAQRLGLGAAFIDAEHAVSFDRMRQLGVDTGNLVFSQPDSGEQALELAESMVRSGQFGLVVIDSVAALTPIAEIERDMGESSMGVQARLMSQAMRKLAAPVSRYNTALVFTNQTRSKIGGYGDMQTTTGGNALKFYASLRLKMQYIGKIVDSAGNQIAGKYRLEVVKNKLAVPYKKVEFEIDENGINEWGALVDQLVSEGILTKAGSWYRLGDDSLAQGREAMKTLLKSDTALRERIYG